jgi:hypothetical protein
MGNKITIALIVLTLGILFYANFVKEDVVVKQSLTISSTTTNILGKEIATALNQIRNLNLDTGIFYEEGYQRLVPSDQEIPILPWGKKSPFDPIEFVGFNNQIPESEVLDELKVSDEITEPVDAEDVE